MVRVVQPHSTHHHNRLSPSAGVGLPLSDPRVHRERRATERERSGELERALASIEADAARGAKLEPKPPPPPPVPLVRVRRWNSEPHPLSLGRAIAARDGVGGGSGGEAKAVVPPTEAVARRPRGSFRLGQALGSIRTNVEKAGVPISADGTPSDDESATAAGASSGGGGGGGSCAYCRPLPLSPMQERLASPSQVSSW
eukprot:SAG11_NODE_496_length_8931_cov_2.956015_1_plen_199_part_00